jgi:hypothetical protein
VPSPLAKLFGVTLCGLQLFLYVFSAVGGPTLWALAHWYGWDDPVRGSWLLSPLLEGWCVIGMVLGVLILLISRRWALPSGVEWGWMGIRLSLLVFLVLFGGYLAGGLEHDLTISLMTGVCLLIPAPLFWQLGSRTIYTILTLTSDDFQVRRRHLLSGANRIFLSYRRKDSQAWTERIADELKAYFGIKAVFQDVEAIPVGVDFRQHLHAQLEQCQVVLVVIGAEWLTMKDDSETRRLDQESDVVRLEIEVALQRKVPLIPLLVDNATMPSQEELPETIRALAFQNGLSIRGNPDFRQDMNRLIQALEQYVR